MKRGEKNIESKGNEIIKYLLCFLFLSLSLYGIDAVHAWTIGTNAGISNQLSPEFNNASGFSTFEAGNWIVWILLFVYFLRQSLRGRTLTFGMLLLIGTTSYWWQDTYQAWSVYILYNPKFHLMPWGNTLWTSPNKAWFCPAGYGAFYTCSFLLVLWLIEKVHIRFPSLGRAARVLIICVPVFYVWDLLNEAGAALNGWYSYTYFFGPAVIGSKGNFPLLYPIVPLVLWVSAVIYLLTFRTPDGRAVYESWFHVERIRNNLQREIARIGVWIVMMNGVYLILTATIVAVRLIMGVPSTLVP